VVRETTKANMDKENGFGQKSIGLIGSLCLLCNNICSAGMVQIPSVFQDSGWLYPTSVFVAVSVLSLMCSLYLCKAVSWHRGNEHFQRRLEFSGLANSLFSRPLYLATISVLVFSFMANNISAIVVSAQAMDGALLAMAHKTCALVIKGTNDTHGPAACISDFVDTQSDSPFGNAYVISIGYGIVMASMTPMAYLNLDDNIWAQIAGIVLLSSCIFIWMAQWISDGLHSERLPTSNTDGFPMVLSTVIFNYGFVATVPSWLNEKGPRVNVVSANVVAVVFATFLYMVLGVFGGLGLPLGSPDVQSAIEGSHSAWTVSKVATYIFPIANLMSSIPVFAILIRYNLMNSGICSKRVANIFAVLLPWVLALFFYAGSQLELLMTWSSALFFVPLNFVVPLLLYIEQYRRVGMHARSRHSFDESDTNLASLVSEAVDEEDLDLLEYHDESMPMHPHEAHYRPRDKLYVLPEWVRANVVSEISVAYGLLAFVAVLFLATLAEQIQTA
jgi:hypothetical protein